MTHQLEIRSAVREDAHRISAIYNHFIDETVVTFEEERVSPQQMWERVEAIQGSFPYLVGVVNDRVIGYAYASTWKGRSAYRFTAESSIYLDTGYIGKGYGKLLYRALVDACRERGFKMLIGGISLPNAASVHLHESLGFKYVGTFHRTGWKQARWIDVGYWELHL